MFSFNRSAQATDAPWNARGVVAQNPTQSKVQLPTSHPLAKTSAILAGPVQGDVQPTIIPVSSRVLSPIFNRLPLPGPEYSDGPYPIRVLPIIRRPAPPPPPKPVVQPPKSGGQGGTGGSSPKPVTQPATPPPQDPGQLLLNGGGDSTGAGAGGIGTSIAIPSPVVVPGTPGNNTGLGLAIVASVVAGGVWYYIEHRKKHERSSGNPAA